MQLLSVKFAELDSQIDATTAQIAALQVHLSEIQEQQQKLQSVEQACQSDLNQADQALAMLRHVDASQVAVFEEAMAAKFVPGSLLMLEPAPEPDMSPEPEPSTPDVPTDLDSLQSQLEQPAPTAKKPPKPAKKSAEEKKLDDIFEERVKEKEQFKIIKDELLAIGIKIGTLISSTSTVKGWNLTWGKDKAGLFWTVGNGWEIESLKPGVELVGKWEGGFDLSQHLNDNGINFEEESKEE